MRYCPLPLVKSGVSSRLGEKLERLDDACLAGPHSASNPASRHGASASLERPSDLENALLERGQSLDEFEKSELKNALLRP